MIECDFAKASLNTTDILTTDNEDIVPSPNIQSSLGFYFFTAEDGECHWEYKTEDDFENYMDLTSDWHPARRSGGTAVVLGWILFIWSLFFSCAAHPKIPRFILGGLLVFLATLQAATFSAMDTDFCDDFSCKYGGDAANSSIVAMVFFAVSGVLFFFTKDYPRATAVGHAVQAEHDLESSKVEPPDQATTADPDNYDGIGEAREVEVRPVESKMAAVY